MGTTVVAPAPGGDPAKIGAMGRVIGVFFSPKATFEDVARKPSWVVPMLILVVCSLALNIVLVNRVDWITVSQKQIEKSKFAASRIESLPEDQRQRAFAQQATIAKYFRYARGVIGFPLLAIIGSAVYMLAFNLLGGAGIRYSTAFSLAAFAHIPLFLHDLLGIPIALLKDPSAINPENVVASNVGALLGTNAPLWQQALGATVDVFSIWCMILVAIAFTAANPRKLTFGKSLGIVFTVYAVFALVGVGIAAAFS
jgi:hypothetical protein